MFTFYHVSCQNSKDQNQLESIIGYSWLPIQQQFQYETILQFNTDQTGNQSTPLGQNTNTQDNTINLSSLGSSNSTNGSQLQPNISISQTNRCSMIKNGTYSLPICFEKLTSGYSGMNYSVFNSNGPHVETIELADIDVDNLPENNIIRQQDCDSDSDSYVNVNTLVNNLNCSNLASNNLTSSNAKSFFDVGLKLVSTVHTQDVYLERFISLANQMKSKAGQSKTNRMYGGSSYVNNRFSGSSHQRQDPDETIENSFKKAAMDICYAESEALIKFL